MRIAMIGSGYVGLVSGACFAQFGHDVVCIDKDPAKIRVVVSGVRCQFTQPTSTPSQAEMSDTQIDNSDASVNVAVKSMLA